MPIVIGIGAIAFVNEITNGMLSVDRQHVASTIDAVVRSRIRQAASVDLPFAIVESDDFQSDAIRAGAIFARSPSPSAPARRHVGRP